VADDPADWNRVLHMAYHAVREREPDRCLVLGSNRWNSVFEFAHLEVPPNDRNLILTYHYYLPMAITHFTASWTWQLQGFEGPIQYPGLAIPQSVFNALTPQMQHQVAETNTLGGPETMEAHLMWPLAVAARTGLPLYCGEFGVYSAVPAEIRRAWYTDYRNVLEKNNIAWANWDFRGGFALFTPDNRKTVPCEVLFPGAAAIPPA
jgi:endoglucanase